MAEMKKKPLSNIKKSLFTDIDKINNQKSDKKSDKVLNLNSFNNLIKATKIEDNMESLPKPQNQNINLNLINFIKQKKKFFIGNSFDKKGTREFLASKEVALKAIKLNDEIVEDNTNNKNYLTNKNVEKINIKVLNDKESDTKKNKISKLKVKRTLSPKKSRKIKQKFKSAKEIVNIKHKKSKKLRKNKKEEYKIENNENNMYILDNSSSNSNIYKFFIDNAFEEENNFNKKLKKELKKVVNLQKNKDTNTDIIKTKGKSLSKKDLKLRPRKINSVISNKKKDVQSIFMFNEINQKLMENDDINVSSIAGDNDSKNNKLNKTNIKRTFGSVRMDNKQIKDQIKNNLSKIIDIDKDGNKRLSRNDLNSDKESIISILSDLM